MEPSTLHKLEAAYLEQDDCLYFALGLAKAASDFRDWAGQAASGAEAAPDEDEPPEAYLHFLLGLISFAGRLEQVLGEPPAPPDGGSPQGPALDLPPRELLR